MNTNYTAEQALKILSTVYSPDEGVELCRVTKTGKVQIRESGKPWKPYKTGNLADHEVQWWLAQLANAYGVQF